MSIDAHKHSWDEYASKEQVYFLPILDSLGFEIDSEQPHLGGERFLMQAVTTTSGRKLVLLGTRKSDNLRVVIKVSTDKSGSKEIEHEHACRHALSSLPFAYHAFPAPPEIMYRATKMYTLFIQKYIETESPFLDRSLEEQFSLILAALKVQEGAQVTTYEQYRLVKKTFEVRGVEQYLLTANTFLQTGCAHTPQTCATIHTATTRLHEGRDIIAQYSGFLTHTDFVPHNFRVSEGVLYLLDHSSIRFGNKYEGWARLLNFMTLYNQPLEQALTQYVKDNRLPREYECLQLMRMYRLTELLHYYITRLPHSHGDLQKLNTARIDFWHTVLTHVINGTSLPPAVRYDYISIRDSLRSPDEQRRQKELH